jgi:hypothetical protein
MGLSPTVIEGRIIFKKNIPAFNGATAFIYLEEVSYADAHAFPVAEIPIWNLSHAEKGDTVVLFKIDIDKVTINSKDDYAIRAWVNLGSDGIASTHDLYSDRNLRVLTNGFGNRVEIIFN